METWMWVLIVVAVVILVALLVLALRRRQQSQALRKRFGPEYDRTVDRAGGRRAAEEELEARAEHRAKLDIRPLDPQTRRRYLESWTDVQRRFVDTPEEAVREANGLVTDVMLERGYPMEDFESRAADISVDHPEVVEDYRRAHAVSLANDDGRATTEDLRQAMVHYRSLFDRLLDTGTDASPSRDTSAGTGA